MINKKILYLFLFLTVFSYFLWLNNSASFVDPDSFYHAKIIDLIKQDGIIKDFPYLPFTTLSDIYIDHHLLYHLILLPLVFFIPSLLAVKFGAAFFAALTILTFQWLLDKFKIKYSFVYTLILLFAHQFIFRINLAKVPSLSLIVLFFFIYLLFSYKQKWSWPLFILSFAYVWLYGGWPIMLGIGGVYWLAVLIHNYLKHKKIVLNLKLISNFILGLIAGLILNPYFPTNLKFYYQQTFQIGIVNYKDIVDVGGEWYGLNIFDLIGYEVLVFILLIFSLLIFFIYFKKHSPHNWTLFLVTFIFFILTLKSQRNVEYFIPFSLLFSAFIISPVLTPKNILIYKKKVPALIPQFKIISYILLALFAFYLPIMFSANFKGLKENLTKNYNFNQLAGISHWLKTNTQPNTIIFHDKWDDWPVLFYHNTHNRYIIGLDPTFMYFKDKRLYWEWKNISLNRTQARICQKVKDKFTSHHIFVKIDNQDLKDNLDLDTNCQLVYQDQDGWIYQIK